MDEAIRVTGLKELARELKRLNSDWPKELRLAAKQAAAIVATDARRRATSAGGVLGKSAPSIKPGGTQRGAYVKIGGTSWPYALGAEFGSVRFRQFKPWRGSGEDAGYALYPAIRAKNAQVVDKFGDMLADLTRRAFPD